MNISTIENATGVLLTLGLVFQDQMEILKVSTHITKTYFKTTRHSHFMIFFPVFFEAVEKISVDTNPFDHPFPQKP